ncbi:ArsR family transcriptional regulator [Burkholderia glumae]|uniref:transcriptional regulator n=1 Tax=Burkholderia glumae TaxID=337 RepID=UPI000C2781B0|nr:transcriptional regulator [Burkholderia glumae]MCM2552123.1 ArsR family transcriptional regulator [Burkholderia glumae]MCQ0031183.1 ArsR family transcriptional regulator [Burkholderia glumae]MCQ0036467.1 ArsR family transcriptional regulator [Burkholderia glumae]MCR1767159.1 ArsR family transcriptional regulator [Burkholderia glumae]NVE24909.1 ArsR family transcriptional regulator [Burkholderia glumae]
MTNRPHDARPDAPRDHDADDADDEGGLDPTVAAVLQQLREALAETPGRAWSLAKLGKRSQVPMSTLRRTLTQLDAAGLTATELGEDGSGHAVLTQEGVALCEVLFGAND